MRLLALHNGMSSFVDDDIYEMLLKYRWIAKKDGRIWYATNSSGKKYTMLHHVICGKPLFGLQIDHIDGNGLNNCRNNLRVVTRRENQMNRMEHRLFNKHAGVKLRGKSWYAQIRINKILIHLGTFKSQEEAKECYLRKVFSLGAIGIQ